MQNGARVKKEITMRDDIDDIVVEESSGNVFADLDYPDAEEALAKSRLAQRIAEIIKKKRLTQVQAGVLCCCCIVQSVSILGNR